MSLLCHVLYVVCYYVFSGTGTKRVELTDAAVRNRHRWSDYIGSVALNV